MSKKLYPRRCKVANTNTREVPKEPNAWLIDGSSYHGTALIDGEERPSTYHWGWITIEKEDSSED